MSNDEPVDRMSNIERWWRVTDLSGRATWVDYDPDGLLQAAWEHATVAGPFVLEAQHAGAVKTFEAIQQVLEDRERAGLLTRPWREDEIGRLILRQLGGQ